MEEFNFNFERKLIDDNDILNSIIYFKYGTIITFIVIIFIWCKRYELSTTKRIRGKEVSIV
jgi:hypothetical protein